MINSSTSDVVYKLGDYAVLRSVDGYNVINTRRSVVTRISKTLLNAVQYIESLVTPLHSKDICLNTYSCKLSEQYSVHISRSEDSKYVVFFGTFDQKTQELVLTRLFDSSCLDKTKKFYLDFVSLYK